MDSYPTPQWGAAAVNAQLEVEASAPEDPEDPEETPEVPDDAIEVPAEVFKLTEENIKDLTQAFHLFDADGGGAIGADELLQLMVALGQGDMSMKQVEVSVARIVV